FFTANVVAVTLVREAIIVAAVAANGRVAVRIGEREQRFTGGAHAARSTAAAASRATSASSGTTASHGRRDCLSASSGSIPAGASSTVCAHHSGSRTRSPRLTSTCAGTEPYRSPLIRSAPLFGTRSQSKPAARKIAATSSSPRLPFARLFSLDVIAAVLFAVVTAGTAPIVILVNLRPER